MDSHNIKKDILYILLIVVGIYVVWFFTGGPERHKVAKPFLHDGTYNQLPVQYDLNN